MDIKVMFSIWMCILTLKNVYKKEIKIAINFLIPSNSNYVKKVIFYAVDSSILEFFFFLRLIEKFLLIYLILILGCALIIGIGTWIYKKIKKINVTKKAS